jgi:hypothetical protein
VDPDPDLGGPKTCGSGGSGSGSATLEKTYPGSGSRCQKNTGSATFNLYADVHTPLLYFFLKRELVLMLFLLVTFNIPLDQCPAPVKFASL